MSSPALSPKPISGWRKFALISFFVGAGFAVTLMGIVFWHDSRPKPPWNSAALTATFDEVRVEGEKHYLTFYYTVQNNTDSDYNLNAMGITHVSVKLERSDSYAAFNKDSSLQLPIFIPAHKRVRVPLKISYSYPNGSDEGATFEQRRVFREQVKEYVKSEMPNLDGFVVFDEIWHYEIDFPPGWKQPSK